MLRRLIVPVILIAVAIGAAVQAQRTDAASDPGEAPVAGSPDFVVDTNLFSARRAPEWLRQPLDDTILGDEVDDVAAGAAAPAQTCVVAYRDDQLVTDVRGDATLVPASLMKLVTAAAMLEIAGPDDTYATEVIISLESTIDQETGVFDGSLFLVGGGDPVLSTPEYISRYDEPRAFTDMTALADAVAAELNRLQVTEISGGIVADESRYPEEERDYSEEVPSEEAGAEPIWKRSFVDENQSGPLSALLLNDGFQAWPEEPMRRENVRASDPAEYAAGVFDDLLEERGFVIRSGTSKGVAPFPAESTSLGRIESPPLRDILTRMLEQSDNTTAEMFLKEIGRRSGLNSVRVSAVFGVFGALQDMGLWREGLVIADGSGLSTYNEISCNLVAEILLRAGPDSALVQSLAVVGESGTLRSCLDGDPDADGEVSGKTGTLNDVTALAGTTVADNGDVITFAMIANGEGVGTELGPCNVLQRTLIAAAAGHPYGPSLDELSPLPATSPTRSSSAGTDPSG